MGLSCAAKCLIPSPPPVPGNPLVQSSTGHPPFPSTSNLSPHSPPRPVPSRPSRHVPSRPHPSPHVLFLFPPVPLYPLTSPCPLSSPSLFPLVPHRSPPSGCLRRHQDLFCVRNHPTSPDLASPHGLVLTLIHTFHIPNSAISSLSRV